jgi:hypothetical protein
VGVLVRAIAVRLGAAAAVAVLVAGCATVSAGHAIKDPGDDGHTVNLAVLDPGNYPRVPAAPLGTVKTLDGGKNTEALRMAASVVLPTDVDAALVTPYWKQITAMITPAGLNVVLPDAITAIVGAHNFVYAFSSERRTEGVDVAGKPRILMNVVMRFASPGDASAAAAEMSARSLTVFPDNHNVPVPVPGHPDTVADTYAEGGGFDVQAYTAHGPYVLYQFTGSKDRVEVAVGLAGAAIDRQLPLLDQFAATPVDQLGGVPLDPTGLLARTVPIRDPGINQFVVFEPRGALHFEADIAAAAQLYGQVGVSAVAVNRTRVYQARDAKSAAAGLAGLAALYAPPSVRYKPAVGVAGLPDARCFDRGVDPEAAAIRYVCVATADRYLFAVRGGQGVDVRQLVAAQYLMLTAPQ